MNYNYGYQIQLTELVQDVLPKVKGGLAVAVIGDHWSGRISVYTPCRGLKSIDIFIFLQYDLKIYYAFVAV